MGIGTMVFKVGGIKDNMVNSIFNRMGKEIKEETVGESIENLLGVAYARKVHPDGNIQGDLLVAMRMDVDGTFLSTFQFMMMRGIDVLELAAISISETKGGVFEKLRMMLPVITGESVEDVISSAIQQGAAEFRQEGKSADLFRLDFLGPEVVMKKVMGQDTTDATPTDSK